ncbi:MAG: pyridine nucleotide-disulfide oxidoreductase [Schaalia hyovaginalis]|uniref:pyridine nucleotide-disulfide oxidoreductase n=1 Tax=Schaalia hyovaginalis TaxID=29316 RepID=UPI002A91579F|nr:pyridine nucleotide-disulfide oxidoreductase [Schaalia hyovaginalis]MDY6213700.1 pyridine nucleotide-disulfide oxidoreductase [Schaalia hyovaginalis]
MNKNPGQGPETMPWGDIGRWMRQSTPVNKGSAARAARRMPQIANPLLIGAIGVGAIGAGIAMRAMRPQRRQGRSERFRDLLLESLDASGLSDIEGCAVEVGEGFGKPSLVSFDVVAAPSSSFDDAVRILDVATRAAWDNPELAPIVIRGRVLRADAAAGGGAIRDEGGAGKKAPDAPSRRLLADMTALGFADEIARPDELYASFGAPASDPAWRP